MVIFLAIYILCIFELQTILDRRLYPNSPVHLLMDI
jgi:hypothetical protein